MNYFESFNRLCKCSPLSAFGRWIYEHPFSIFWGLLIYAYSNVYLFLSYL